MAIRRPVNNPLDEAHPYETWAINALLAVFLLIFLGLGLAGSVGINCVKIPTD